MLSSIGNLRLLSIKAIFFARYCSVDSNTRGFNQNLSTTGDWNIRCGSVNGRTKQSRPLRLPEWLSSGWRNQMQLTRSINLPLISKINNLTHYIRLDNRCKTCLVNMQVIALLFNRFEKFAYCQDVNGKVPIVGSDFLVLCGKLQL